MDTFLKEAVTHNFDGTTTGRHGSGSSTLHRYANLKLELAGIIRSTLNRSRERKDDELENRARNLLVRLSEDRFYLAVLGQHKRGKSSLMNAMIGRDLLPTGILPVTSAIIALHYDSELRIRIRHQPPSHTISIPLDQLRDYVSEQDNPGNVKRVETADVGVPSDVLRYGFYFVDTPGIGSAIAANTATTEAFLPEADAAIFVTSFDSPMNEVELNFLDDVRHHVGKMFFVINKSDLVSAGEREQVAQFVRQRITERTGTTPGRIYIISAKEQIESAKKERAMSGGAGAGDRGIAALRRDLQIFLVSEKSREFMKRVAQRAAILLENERLQSRLIRWTSNKNDLTVNMETVITQLAEESRADARQIVAGLKAESAARLEEYVTASFSLWREREAAWLTAEISRIFDQHKFLLPAFQLPEQFEVVRRFCETDASAWLQAETPEMNRLLHAIVEADAARLASLGPSILVAAAERLGLDGRLEQTAAASSAAPDLRLRLPANAPPFEWNWHPPFWSYFVPAWAVAEKLIGSAASNLSAALVGYENRVTSLVSSAGKRWVDELAVKTEKNINAGVENIKEGMHGPSSRDHLEQIDANLTRVSVIANVLNEKALSEHGIGSPPDSAALLDAAPRAEALKPCIVCREMMEALGAFLSRYQYDLAVDEAFQSSHAECGGFCPLHTWMYESIASPQGMSAGYAATVERTSERLRSIATSVTASEYPAEVERIVPSTAHCPACEMLANALQDFIDTQADCARKGFPSPLCVPHLQQVLVKLNDSRAAKKLILERAAVLERIAADMRMFALKHDAVRHSLTVSEESNAYRRGLRDLAGEKNLSMARPLD